MIEENEQLKKQIDEM
ncbi:unnamed protein product, partial [Rotaria sordida]